jgi:hypothetical protein
MEQEKYCNNPDTIETENPIRLIDAFANHSFWSEARSNKKALFALLLLLLVFASLCIIIIPEHDFKQHDGKETFHFYIFR